MKNLTKKQKITYVVITIIILAIIGTIIGVVTHKAKKPELIECKETEQQIKEEATNELPKDYKGEVDIVEQEIKEEVIDEKTGEKKTVTKKVIKQVPKGTKVQGGKVIGTTTTTKINQTKPNTTAPKTTKPNTTAPKTNKPNTTKPKTTVPTTKKVTQERPITWTYSATKAYIKSKGGQWDDSKTLYNSTWITTDERTQEEMNSAIDYRISQGDTHFKIIIVNESNWKQYDRDFNGYNRITPSDREYFQNPNIKGQWLLITLHD